MSNAQTQAMLGRGRLVSIDVLRDGYGLPGVYLATLAALAILYFPCREYARIKARSHSWWTRFL